MSKVDPDTDRFAAEARKEISVAAPVEDVFRFWKDPGNFPRAIREVRGVSDIGGGRFRWRVSGPAGLPVEWDTRVTRLVPNELIAWESMEGSGVEHAGAVRFEPNPDGTTRVRVRLGYNPPAGAVGQALAALLGSDPESRLGEALKRIKTFIETREPFA